MRTNRIDITQLIDQMQSAHKEYISAKSSFGATAKYRPGKTRLADQTDNRKEPIVGERTPKQAKLLST